MEKYSIEPYEDKNETSDYRREEAYMRARKKVDSLIGFYWHLAVYIIVNAFLILLIGLNSDDGFGGFGPYATAIFWGIGLLFHFLGVFGPDFIFGKDWEQRKIKEFMDKEHKDWN
ncbi:2TM domain-containing protein [Winogradskyella sp. DF17]|uniref:2TM domain-containing protein n=1 Tax=Winogradskyella pelagia TaxID=2819984 RepID=A0ABS3T077_9FLAO|nr:2TM domain-containing protein [Winogradskyella sp. DF17]MBO3116148.1 2TM domain-containing protein [Winogradskyella sp. DF17]